MSKKPSKLEQRLRLGRHSLFGPKTSSPVVHKPDEIVHTSSPVVHSEKPVVHKPDTYLDPEKRKQYRREWMRAHRTKKVK